MPTKDWKPQKSAREKAQAAKYESDLKRMRAASADQRNRDKKLEAMDPRELANPGFFKKAEEDMRQQEILQRAIEEALRNHP